MKILFVLTSHDQLGDSGRKTGFWLEEFVAPYYVFKDAGFAITLASPKGGKPPVDPNSETEDFQTEATRRFMADEQSMEALRKTVKLAEIATVDGYNALFYPGGHGPVWDLSEDKHSIALLEEAVSRDIPLGTVCHGPASLRRVKGKDGRPLVSGKSVTGFSNSEEEAFKTTDVVPFLIEDMLKQNGGKYTSGPDWQQHVVQDELLVTGQNPASSQEAGRQLLDMVKRRFKE